MINKCVWRLCCVAFVGREQCHPSIQRGDRSRVRSKFLTFLRETRLRIKKKKVLFLLPVSVTINEIVINLQFCVLSLLDIRKINFIHLCRVLSVIFGCTIDDKFESIFFRFTRVDTEQ